MQNNKDQNPQNTPSMILLVGSTGIAIFMSALDASVVNISLPVIARYFKVPLTDVRWIVLAYLVVITSLLAFAGKLGDRYGNKQVFQICFIIFGFGSFLCSLSWNLPMLIGARIIQALGASGIMSNGIALITQFTNPENRGRAIGLNSLVVASALSIGPFIGGALTEHVGWQSIFLINIPISIIGFVAVQKIVPTTQHANSEITLDWIGTVLFGSGLAFLILGLTLIQNSSFAILGFSLVILSIGCISFLIPYEKKIQNPIVDFNLFSDRRISIGVITAVLAYSTIGAFNFLLPWYYQDVRNLGPTETGLMILALPVFMSFVGPIAGYLSENYDARFLSSIGLLGLIIAFSLLSFFLIDPSVPIVWLVLVAAIIGISTAFFTSPNSNSIMSSTPKQKLGLSGGFIALARNIGFVLGITIGSSLLGIFLGEESTTTASKSLYAKALSLTFLFFVGASIIGILLSIKRGPDNRKAIEITNEATTQ